VRPRRLLLDTNLLILLVVGLTDLRIIARHKRLQHTYDVTDFREIVEYVRISDGLVFCPHVLAETSNLLRQTSEPDKSRISDRYRLLIGSVNETLVSSLAAANHPEFNRLGLTDSVLLLMSAEGGALITDDLPLFLAAQRTGAEAINYNHVRQNRPDFQ
jgi:hypothetical protein